jgi:hypothetical protein
MAKWWRLERRPAAAWESRPLDWLTGTPPPKGASALERLRFVRRVSGRAMLFYVPILVVVLALGTSTWFSLLICALVLLSSANLLAITRKIRRAERAERETR